MNICWIIILYSDVILSVAFSAHGCSVQHKRRKESAELQFRALVVHPVEPVLAVSNVIKSPNGSTLLTALYTNGKLFKIPDCNGCVLTGGAETGNLNVRLDNLQEFNGGTYKLLVNGREKTESCITLIVLDVPTKPTLTPNKDPPVGESVTLTCSSTSRTAPSNHGLILIYTWRVDGTDNPSDSRYSYSTYRKTLTLYNVVKADASKRFTCTATENVTQGYTSSSSDSYSPNVLYGPEELTFDPSYANYMKEENQTLGPITCDSVCNPPCTFTWKNVDKETVVSSESTLSLDVLTSLDAGTYQCIASRSGTNFLTKNLTVNVIYGPRQIKLVPDNTIYREDENSGIKNITCSSNCYVCEYSWTGPNGFISKDSVLSLSRINRTMAGTYSCTATNTKSSKPAKQRKDVKIDVRYGPDSVRLIPEDSNYNVEEGTHIKSIRCLADCFPNCTYKWMKGPYTTVSETDILMMGTIQRSYAGNYTCTAVNKETSSKPVQTTVSIVVKYAADISIELSTTNITEGASLTLFCKGSGVPSMYTYVSLIQKWNTIEINNDNTELAGTTRYSSIHFNQLQLQDSGTYTCTLNNGIRNESGILNQASSRNIFVKVRPKVLRRDLNFAGVTKGTVDILVPVYSYPKLTSASITRYDDMEIKSDNKYDLSIQKRNVTTDFYNKEVSLSGNVISLTIRDLEESDFGNYTIKLTNSLGSTFSTLFVIAEGKPSPPKIFLYLPKYEVPTFLWQKSFNGGPEQSFVIQTSIVGADEWKNHTNIQEKDLQYKINEAFYLASITDLQPGVYNARIYSTNSRGDSELVNLNQTFEISMNEEGAYQTDSQCKSQNSDQTALIVGIILGLVCCVLASATTYLAISRMRTIKKEARWQSKTKKQPVYANTSFASEVVEHQEYENFATGHGESFSQSQYTDLYRYANTDKDTYDVIKKE